MDARGLFAFASRSVRLAAALALAVALGTPSPGHTQIVRDGTVGPAGPLIGPNYTIPHTDGTRAGGNLFHSFGRFNLHTGESATFTGPGDLANVISRVTGGERSTIGGVLRSQIGRADFWFINPSGVVFGPHAQIDVPAAFHVSTADEVRLADGARFSASDPPASRLTVAPPEAFGFLRPTPASIAVQGSTLQTQAGQTLSVIGGDLHVTGGQIGSESGQVNLVAMAGPGTVRAKDGAPSVPAGGAVRLAPKAPEQGARVDTSGDGGGRIALRGGQIEVTGSSVLADNTGAQNAKGGITVTGDTVRVADGSQISSSTRARGSAGRVAVTGRELTVRNGAVIRSVTSGQGNAGTVTAQADRLLVSRDGSQTSTNISSGTETGATGHAGEVRVTGRDIAVRNGGQIYSATFSKGNAGTVTIHADRLLVSHEGATTPTVIASSAEPGSSGHAGNVTVTASEIALHNGGQIHAATSSQGRAGMITVMAHNLQVRDGGIISSKTSGRGQAGSVLVQADRLVIAGNGRLSFFGINSDTEGGSGHAGDVVVTGHDIEVRNGGRISSSTYGPGQAGTVTLHTDRLVLSGDGGLSGISSDSFSTGDAGSVVVRARDLELVKGGQISSNTYNAGHAGAITVQADRMLVSNDGALFPTGIVTFALPSSTGRAGTVAVMAGEMELRNGGEISSDTAGRGHAGSVTVQADRLVISADRAPVGAGIWSRALIKAGDAGTVTVTARELELRSGGSVSSSTFGAGSAGAVVVQADRLVLSGDGGLSGISSDSFSTGDAGSVAVRARDLELVKGGQISSDTYNAGHAGAITVQADRMLVSGDGALFPTGITSDAGLPKSSGKAGDVSVTVSGSLEVRNGGRISSDTLGAGSAGAVTVRVGGLLVLRNKGSISSDTYAAGHAGTVTVEADQVRVIGNPGLSFTGISSETVIGSGAAGAVTVAGREIELRDGGQISSRSRPKSSGAGGTVIVTGADVVLVDGAAITTQSDSPESAGAVTVTAQRGLALSGGARITSSASLADAGRITITVGESLRLTGSAITTQAGQGGGGQIHLTVGRLADLIDSQITSSVVGQASTRDAGNITLDPPFLVLDRASRIEANAVGGNGGEINIEADVIPSPDSTIRASSQTGRPGRIVIAGPERNIAGSLTALPIDFLDARALLPTACAARLGGASSLTAARSARLPADPDWPLLPSYLSYTGHQPLDRAVPFGGAAEEGAQEAGLDPVPSGAGRLSFACGI